MATPWIDMKADVSECLRFFDGINANKVAIRKKLMGRVGTGAKQAVKKNFTNYLHKRSGTLYKSVYSKVSRNGGIVIITNNADSGKPTAKDGRNARYGFMLASGYTIEAKTPTGLTFQINGKWIRKHSVTVSPKDWVEPSVTKYVESGECKTRLDKEFQKQVDYWNKRITGTRA